MEETISSHNKQSRSVLRSKCDNGQLSGLFSPVICIIIFTQFTGLQFSQFGVLLTLQRILLVLMVAGLFIVHFYRSARGKGLKFDLVSVLILFLVAWFAILTMFNSGSISELFQKTVYIAGPWLFFAVFGVDKPAKTINACNLAFMLLTILNLIGVIGTYHDGGFAPELETYWLFGQRTYMRNILFPALFFSVLSDWIRGKKCSVATVFLMVQNPLVLYAVNSMTSFVLSLVIDVLLVAIIGGARLKRVLIAFGAANIVLGFTFVVIRQLSWASSFIVNVLQRDLTFSGRAIIWDLVLEKIKSSPIFGTGFHGINDNGLVLSATKNVSNAHNELLDVMYKGGGVAILAFLALIIRCCIPVAKSKKTRIAGLLGIFLGAFFIEAVVADIWYPQFFLLLYFAAYVSLWEEVIPDQKRSTPHNQT